MLTSNTTPEHQHEPDDRFADLLTALQTTIDLAAKGADRVSLYTTEPTGLASLYDIFLAALPESRRQHYACRTCRQFVERFAGLVTIDERGQISPAVWPESVDGPLSDAVHLVHSAIERSRVTGVFFNGSTPWGVPLAGHQPGGNPWSHMAVRPPTSILDQVMPRPASISAHQAAATKREDRGILTRSLADFSMSTVAQATAALKAGQLYRSEVAQQIAEWFLALHERLVATKNERHRENLIWCAAATAPAGWCHVRSSMLGTLLEDMSSGMAFESVARRWSEKMHPLHYQRPQAPPSAGNVKRAEELFAELGLAPALRRRYARLGDLQKLWVPQGYTRTAPLSGVSASPGVFAHVAVKDTGRTSFKPSTAQTTSGSAKMTLVKFRRDVMPGAAQIELVIPRQPAAWSALVTAVDPEAPPILQWDRPDRRNPTSWYLYTDGNGRLAAGWNLTASRRYKVDALVLAPNLWRNEADPAAQHHGRKLFVIVEGCRDTIYERGGGFFPSMLRGELREVRATLEAHAKAAKIETVDVPACGLMLQDDPKSTWDCELWVTDRHGVVSRYVLDRWE